MLANDYVQINVEDLLSIIEQVEYFNVKLSEDDKADVAEINEQLAYLIELVTPVDEIDEIDLFIESENENYYNEVIEYNLVTLNENVVNLTNVINDNNMLLEVIADNTQVVEVDEAELDLERKSNLAILLILYMIVIALVFAFVKYVFGSLTKNIR